MSKSEGRDGLFADRPFEWAPCFRAAKAHARGLGANFLYISATPSQATIDFYLALGCVPTLHADLVLLALEPEDIHLEGRVDSDD